MYRTVTVGVDRAKAYHARMRNLLFKETAVARSSATSVLLQAMTVTPPLLQNCLSILPLVVVVVFSLLLLPTSSASIDSARPGIGGNTGHLVYRTSSVEIADSFRDSS